MAAQVVAGDKPAGGGERGRDMGVTADVFTQPVHDLHRATRGAHRWRGPVLKVQLQSVERGQRFHGVHSITPAAERWPPSVSNLLTAPTPKDRGVVPNKM